MDAMTTPSRTAHPVTTLALGGSHRATTVRPRCGRPGAGYRMRRPGALAAPSSTFAGPGALAEASGGAPPAAALGASASIARPGAPAPRRAVSPTSPPAVLARPRRGLRARLAGGWWALAGPLGDASPSRRALDGLDHVDRSPRA